ncbi:hypothetical protein K504DRAFT_466378 [Pleomassaria siparia CBS 279.74]|uniref:Uncharacterized protein n=1 Tax=Pleomassaria siparia CBS 279.74 TaxID=1314801 RepID=A0A6G1KBT3_9PLEO|nr:hypothetical protein K504DRAFT_466378 [Pleomassaria siparia CBS 279.74]
MSCCSPPCEAKCHRPRCYIRWRAEISQSTSQRLTLSYTPRSPTIESSQAIDAQATDQENSSEVGLLLRNLRGRTGDTLASISHDEITPLVVPENSLEPRTLDPEVGLRDYLTMVVPMKTSRGVAALLPSLLEYLPRATFTTLYFGDFGR